MGSDKRKTRPVRFLPFALMAALPIAAGAQPVPPPARVCVPQALLEKLAANVARQPWADVAPLMDEMRSASRAFTPCPAALPPAPPKPPEAPTP